MRGDVLPLNCQLCPGMHMESTPPPPPPPKKKKRKKLDIVLLIFTIHSNILVLWYSDRIWLSSMHSIYDESLCFATSTDDCVLACTWNRPKPKTTAKISKCSFWFSQYIASILVLLSSKKILSNLFLHNGGKRVTADVGLHYSADSENVYWVHFELGDL